MKNNKYGFTLVELLAVIVILAIILVIAVPKVMDVIKDSKKATLESTAKMIASSAEKVKVQNDLLGKTEELECKSVAKINDIDYANCDIDFDGNTAKVTIEGAGKFEGLYVCGGTKTNSIATDEECSGSTGSVEVGEFGKDSWETIVAAVQQAQTSGAEYPYNVGDKKTVDMDVDGNGTAEQYTIRIANKTKCSALQTQPTSKSACGFVLEFADIITEHSMNGADSASSTNIGGWPKSEMRKYLNDLDAEDKKDGAIYNALPKVLKDGIIETYVVSSPGNESIIEYENVIERNFYSIDKLYLLSTEEVFLQGEDNKIEKDASRGTSRQLDYYAYYKGIDSNGIEYKGVSTMNYEGAIKTYMKNNNIWWMRSSTTNGKVSFHYVKDTGDWNYTNSYRNYGVSPAFRLGE